MPGLLARIERGEPVDQMARAVGETLFRVLPCLSIEVVNGETSADQREAHEPCREAVLFVAHRGPDEPGNASDSSAVPASAELTSAQRGSLALRAMFVTDVQARAFRPLLETAVQLIALAPTGRPGSPKRESPPKPPAPPDPPTVDATVRRIYSDAARVARGTVGVLITGESGTGKEVLARFLHEASPRSEQSLVALNCAALPRDLLESELFGIEQGVATGVQPRAGKFELADGGTLFLDEIGDMAPETQARILRVLQEREVYRLGANKPRQADVRVVAATNRDLEELIDKGDFRADLYHRIADWTVELPPLRERRGDIPNLAAHFLREEAERQGIAVAGISHGAIDVLRGYSWPGNVRQLQREMARVVLFLEDEQLLQSTVLKDSIRSDQRRTDGSLKDRLEDAEARILRTELANHDGNVVAAAEALGVGRSTLYRRIKELGLEEG